VTTRGGCSSRKYLDDRRSEVSGQDGSARVNVGDNGKSTDGDSKTKTVVLRPEQNKTRVFNLALDTNLLRLKTYSLCRMWGE